MRLVTEMLLQTTRHYNSLEHSTFLDTCSDRLRDFMNHALEVIY